MCRLHDLDYKCGEDMIVWSRGPVHRGSDNLLVGRTSPHISWSHRVWHFLYLAQHAHGIWRTVLDSMGRCRIILLT